LNYTRIRITSNNRKYNTMNFTFCQDFFKKIIPCLFCVK